MRSTGLGRRRATAGGVDGSVAESCSSAQQPGQIVGTAASALDTDDPQVGHSVAGICGVVSFGLPARFARAPPSQFDIREVVQQRPHAGERLRPAPQRTHDDTHFAPERQQPRTV
jgi:hypothetical protein